MTEETGEPRRKQPVAVDPPRLVSHGFTLHFGLSQAGKLLRELEVLSLFSDSHLYELREALRVVKKQVDGEET